MKDFHVSVKESIEQLAKEISRPFTIMMRDGMMSVEYFAPDKIDTQNLTYRMNCMLLSKVPEYFYGIQRVTINAGDVLFVPAGMEHRFVKFTDDFATWVIFYGPEGE